MELRHLRYFLAVAEHLNFTRAAAQLRVAQPALSTQIRDLENELGVRLFERTNRRVELSPAGKVFREHALSVVESSREMVSRTRLAAKGEIGRLAIGYVAWLRPERFNILLSRFHQLYPGVDITLADVAPHEQAHRLLDGSLQIGFVSLSLDPLSPHLSSHRVAQYPLRLVMPEKHRLRVRRAVDLAAVADEPFISLSSRLSPVFAGWIRNVCLDRSFTPNVTHEVSRPETALDLVEAGLGVTLLADIGSRMRAWQVHLCPLAPAAPEFYQSMVWRTAEASPIVKAFIALAKSTLTVRR